MPTRIKPNVPFLHRARRLGAWLLLPLLFAVTGKPASSVEVRYNTPPPLAAGTRAWNFHTRTLSGRPLTLRSLRGHVTVIDFWATWCFPCRMAIPGLEQIYQQYKPRGVRVVGMSMDTDTLVNVRPFADMAHMTYLVAADPQANQIAADHYRVAGLPSVYIVDKRGVVRWSCEGFSFDQDHLIRAELNKLLAEKG